MIIATYKQWLDGSKYLSGYYKEYTSIYKDKSELQTELKHWEEEGNPMIILGLWEI